MHEFADQVRMLNAEMEKFSNDSLAMMQQSIKLAIRPILKEMRNEAPVKTGATKRALGIIQRKDKIILAVRANKDYGATGGLKPAIYAPYADRKKPWFTRIWRREEPTIDKTIADSMGKAVEKVKKSIQRKMLKSGITS